MDASSITPGFAFNESRIGPARSIKACPCLRKRMNLQRKLERRLDSPKKHA
jgi:hypothetical protein